MLKDMNLTDGFNRFRMSLPKQCRRYQSRNFHKQYFGMQAMIQGVVTFDQVFQQ